MSTAPQTIRRTFDLKADALDALDNRIGELRRQVEAHHGRVLHVVRWHGGKSGARAEVSAEIPATEDIH